MSEHTKEPWVYETECAYGWDIRGDEIWIASVQNSHVANSRPQTGFPSQIEGFANARRIVACVNACADLPTELLESLECGLIPANETAAGYGERATEAERLLAALVPSDFDEHPEDFTQEWHAARAFLDRAKP